MTLWVILRTKYIIESALVKQEMVLFITAHTEQANSNTFTLVAGWQLLYLDQKFSEPPVKVNL